MIQNGCLTYPGADSLFRNWQPNIPFIYELMFASVTTCLVYQMSKICLDLGLGQRVRGKVKISDLNLLILVSNFSIRSIFSSFGCNGIIARRRFHGKVKTCTEESPVRKGIGCPVLAKLFVLLISGPVIHMIGIYLSTERDQVVTFGDVGFRGIALGLNDKGPVIDETSSFFCPRMCTSYARGEVPLTEFSRCNLAGAFPFQNDLQNGTFILILRSSLLDIGVTLVTPGRRWISILFLDIHTGERAHRLRNIITEEQRNDIFEQGLQEMTRSCTPEIRRDVNISDVIPPPSDGEPRQWIISSQVKCDNYAADELENIGGSMLDNVTIQSTEKMEIGTDLSDAFTSGEDLGLLLRRTSTATLFAMLIATVIAIALRSVIRLVLHNEGHLAVETIIKDRLQMKCCDSMLQVEKKVYYRDTIVVEDDDFLSVSSDGRESER